METRKSRVVGGGQRSSVRSVRQSATEKQDTVVMGEAVGKFGLAAVSYRAIVETMDEMEVAAAAVVATAVVATAAVATAVVVEHGEEAEAGREAVTEAAKEAAKEAATHLFPFLRQPSTSKRGSSRTEPQATTTDTRTFAWALRDMLDDEGSSNLYTAAVIDARHV